MIYAGIDPGEKGAVAFLRDDDTYSYEDFYSHERYIELLKEHQVSLVCLEKLWGIPPSSAATNFNLGLHFGCCQMALKLSNTKSIEVAAKTWQLKILQFRGSNKDRAAKKASIAYVNKRFPGLGLHPLTLKQIDEMSGIADAICLALYARYVYTNQV